MRVAFAGLGVMGYPMAGFLVTAGHDVCVYNRTSAKADRWCEEHGEAMRKRRLRPYPIVILLSFVSAMTTTFAKSYWVKMV